MPLPSRLMGSSASAAFATQVCGDVSEVVATGTTQANSLSVTTAIVISTTTAAGTGVVLPPAEVGGSIIVHNLGANALLVYPNRSTDVINALGAGAGFSVAAAKMAFLVGRANGTGWVAGVTA